MTYKRLLPALASVVLLLGCDNAAEEGTAAPGEVLEGSISDAMLPIDRVRSEAPPEDPEALVEARSAAAESGEDAVASPGGETEPVEAEPAADGEVSQPEPAAEG